MTPDRSDTTKPENHPPAQQGTSLPGGQRPTVTTFEAYHPAAGTGPAPSRLVIGAVVACLVLVGLGVMRGVLFGSSEAKAAKPEAKPGYAQQPERGHGAGEGPQKQPEHVERVRGRMPDAQGSVPDPEAGDFASSDNAD